MFCLDTSSGTIPSLKALFKYEKFAETLYPYIKSQISGNSAFSGLYDSEKLASFCETKSEIKYFHRNAAGATLFFDDSTFAGEGKTLKLFISNSVLDTAGKPGGTDNYNPVVDNNEKVIALSFDDGPNPLQTPRLLDMIERYGIKVTFFQIGEQIGSKDGKVFPESKKILERQISLGCEIGNHSYTHANFNNITDAEAKKELELTSSLITSACGEYPILFRPPGGNIKNKKSLCTELGYFIINWAVDTEDWKLKKLATEEATAQILQTVKSNAKSGRIILMHDLYKNSVDAAEHVIEYLLSEGYRFVTISELCDLRNKTPDGQVIFNRSSLA
ncbi:hypothetical protein SDC9_119115 [bioreactor metagenome]|uniref:NodB homology domain-containing protein n=1 Tax=bioreactor metagenome TaxID=1076179 RepID=A0A645C3A5_9ZZZZ